MPVLLMGYDVSSNQRRRHLRRAIERYLPAMQKSAMQGALLSHDICHLLAHADSCTQPDTDGLVLARLLSGNEVKQPHFEQTATSAMSPSGLLILN